MKEEEIVKKICEIMEVKYSHYDNHNMPLNYLKPEVTTKSKPKIIIYSSSYGRWQFAILEDMSIVDSTCIFIDGIKSINKTLELLIKKSKNSKNINSEELESYKKLIKEGNEDFLKINEKFSKAEKFLKENNCAEIINNPNKIILHM